MPTSQASGTTTGGAVAGTIGGAISFFLVVGLIFLIVDDQQASKWGESMNVPTKVLFGTTLLSLPLIVSWAAGNFVGGLFRRPKHRD